VGREEKGDIVGKLTRGDIVGLLVVGEIVGIVLTVGSFVGKSVSICSSLGATVPFPIVGNGVGITPTVGATVPFPIVGNGVGICPGVAVVGVAIGKGVGICAGCDVGLFTKDFLVISTGTNTQIKSNNATMIIVYLYGKIFIYTSIIRIYNLVDFLATLRALFLF
jgi:hypothetical protein